MQNAIKFSSISKIVTGLAAAAIVAQALTGCSGTTSSLPVTASQQLGMRSTPPVSSTKTTIQPDIENGAHFSSASGNCIVTYYYDPVKQIWEYAYDPPSCDPAEGIFSGFTYDVGMKGYLVGESSASENVIAVENSKGQQIGTLSGLTGDPVGIAVGPKGDVWASNYPSNAVSEYNAGATKPTATYTDGNLSSLRYVALDQTGNVYVSGQSAGSRGLEVDELQGSTFAPIKTITGAVGAGITVSPKTKTLWVCDEGNGTSGTISGYTMPGFRRRMQFTYSGDDTGIAVAPSGSQVYAVDNVASGSEFQVTWMVYSAKTGKVVNSTPTLTTSAKVLGISNHE